MDERHRKAVISTGKSVDHLHEPTKINMQCFNKFLK